MKKTNVLIIEITLLLQWSQISHARSALLQKIQKVMLALDYQYPRHEPGRSFGHGTTVKWHYQKWQVRKHFVSTNPSLCRTTQCLHICSITNFSKEETTNFIWRMLLIRTNGCQWKIWTSQNTQYNFSFM